MDSLEQKLNKNHKRFNRVLALTIAGTIAAAGTYYTIEHPEQVYSAYETIKEYVVGK